MSSLLTAESLRLRPLKMPKAKEERKEKDRGQAVVLRGRSRRVPTPASDAEGDKGEEYRGSLQNSANKRNATYLTQEEYDEDLAQLDILLHYVNNLSASLEFLQWENKRISTDLVPTLLNMYDALYARLSETPHTGEDSQDSLPKKEESDEEDTNPGKQIDTPGGGDTRRDELFITEPESSAIERTPSVGKLKTQRRVPPLLGLTPTEGVTLELPCVSRESQSSSVVENDYDIPESIERPPGAVDPYPCDSPSRYSSHKSTSPASPRKGRARGVIPYRPVSVISSSSSASSSSSNSLPRGPIGGLASSYLASAESLEDNDVPPCDAEVNSRRRDRSLKARREKALRTGSGDSGVQCHIISLPVPPTMKPRYCDPNLDYMDRVVLEIVETEEVYVRDLREVIQGYLEQWRRNPEPGIPSSTIESLFSNIEQIYTFNRCFLSELEKCGSDPVAVAKCFVRNNSGFAIYTEYCTNYPRTVSLLTDLMRNESSVRACRERQLCLGHTLPLGSYLLKPVQRVLKYHLLLGNIEKRFSKDRVGHEHIWNALAAMTGIAHHINDMKRKHEHAVRVQEIQSLLYGWQGEDLTTYGELAAEGNFKMFGFKGLRHVFLFDKILLIAKRKDENILVYKAHIMCSDLMLIESIPGEPLNFHVIPFNNPKSQYTLECRNLEQKREWTLQLKRVILENYNATIPPHARQLVMELGQAKSNDLSANEWKGGSRKTHHAPEYLERRKDKRRASETGLNARLRIRRSSRARKNKEDKENRSRSASRTRETDEDDERKLSTNTPSPADKSKLKLSMWRRRSEPHVRGQLRISSPEVSQTSPVENNFSENWREERKVEECDKTISPDKEEKETTEPSRIEPECEVLYDQIEEDDNEAVDGENLEHIVSQLLQHQLQMQQIILNKQRRGLVRKKKFGTQYETSDTENDDGGFESRPPLPSSPPPPLSGSTQPSSASFPSTNYLQEPSDIYSIFREKQNGEWSSGPSSLGSSAYSVARKDPGHESKEKSPKASNYDNLQDVWRNIPSKLSPQHENISKMEGGPEETLNGAKASLRRVHSFSSSPLASKEDYKADKLTSLDPSFLTSHNGERECDGRGSCSHPEGESRERPVTIAVYDPSLDTHFEPLYVEGNRGGTPQSFPLTPPASSSSLSMKGRSRFSIDDLMTVHPDHKIYSKASVNKGSIKKVLSRLTGTKGVFQSGGSPTKTISEPSYSLSSLYTSNEFDRTSTRKGSGLVSTMARQCSRTLKERIKQIRTEDLEPPKVTSSTNLLVPGLPSYKQGSPSMGARLAAAASVEQCDYAVPVIRPNVAAKSELRPDSVLSSSSVWTSSSSSSSHSSNREPIPVPEEVIVEPPIPQEGDLSGDSFYEKSFEAIESFLDDEMFRDSAIYSEPEEGQETPSSARSGTLSPKHSFNYKHRSSFRVDHNGCIDSLVLSPQKYDVGASRKGSIAEELLLGRSPPLALVSPSRAAEEENETLSSTTYRNMPITSTSPSSRVTPVVTKKVPPPVPAKPDSSSVYKFRSRGALIQQQLRHLEQRNTLENQRQYSPSLQNTPKDICFDRNGEAMPKGWVKHVVGKLQQ